MNFKNSFHQLTGNHLKPAHEALVSFIKSLTRNFIQGRCLDNAGILTITTLLALVPMIATAYSALRLMPGMEDISGQIQSWLFAQFVPSKVEDIQGILSSFAQQTSKLTLVGSIMLIVTSVMMLARVESCLNAIWQVPPQNAGMSSFLRYWAILSLGPIFIGAGVILTSYITSIKVFDEAFDYLSIQEILLTIFPALLTLCAFTLIYVAVPNCSVPASAGLVGALFAAIIFEIAKRLFAWFIATFPSYELIYGAFAALPIFIIWLNLSWVIVLLGGVVSRTMATDILRKRTLPNVLAGVEILQVFWIAQQNGEFVSDRKLFDDLPWLPRDQWDEIRKEFVTAQLITPVASGGYVLTRSLEHLSQGKYLQIIDWMSWLDFNMLPSKDLQAAQACAKDIDKGQNMLSSKQYNGSLSKWFVTTEV